MQKWVSNCPHDRAQDTTSCCRTGELFHPQHNAGFVFRLQQPLPKLLTSRMRLNRGLRGRKGDDGCWMKPDAAANIHTNLLTLSWPGAELCISFAWGAQQASICAGYQTTRSAFASLFI